MTIEIISQSMSMKVWDWAGIELANPGSTVRHVTDCTNGSGDTLEQNIIPAWNWD